MTSTFLYVGNVRPFMRNDNAETGNGTRDDDGLLSGRRRSFLRVAGGSIGLSALGGSAVGPVGASHESSTFQVDLVESTPSNLKDPLDEGGTTYSDDSVLIRWIWGDDAGNTAEGGDAKYDPYTASSGNTTVSTQNGVELDQTNETATVNLSVSGDPVDLSLVSYNVPSSASLGWDPVDASMQYLYDIESGTFDSDASLTVGLPTKTNLLSNDSVENGDLGNDNPSEWGGGTNQGSVTREYVDAEAHTGSRSLKISSSSGGEGYWQQGATADPTKSYGVTGWFKSNNLSGTGGARLEVNGSKVKSSDFIDGTTPFTQIRMPFRLDGGMNVATKFGYAGQATGTAWYDDIVMREIPGRDPTFGREAAYTLDETVPTATNSETGTDASVTGSPSTDEVGIDDDAFGFTTNGDTSTAADALTSGSKLPINGANNTVAAWFNYTDNESAGRIFQVGGSGPDDLPTDGFNLEISSGNMALIQWDGGTATNVGGYGISKNTWYFVVVTHDGGNFRYHLFDTDGELAASPLTGSSSRGTSSNENLVMMAGDGRDVAGRLDQVRAHSRTFTEAEAWRLYQGTQGDLKAYYSLDGSTATNAFTGIDASVTGSPSSGAVGINGTAFDFGRGANVDSALSSGTSLPINGEGFTVAGWLNYDSHEGAGRFLQLGGTPSSLPSDGFSLEMGQDDIYPVAWNGFSADIGGTSIELSSGTWYFIALAVNGNDFRLHVYDQSSELGSSPQTYTLVRGQSGSEDLNMMAGDDSEVEGRLDEVYAYARQFSQSEVDTLYNDSTA